MTTLQGVLEFHSETGTEGGCWAFQDASNISLGPARAIFGHGETVYDPATGQRGRAIKAQHADGQRVTSIPPGAVIHLQIEWADGTRNTRLMSELLSERWSYEGLHTLKDGDQLTVYDPADITRIIWNGTIQLQLHPLFTEHIHGFWIHADQLGVERDVWAQWFLNRYPAQLIREN